MTNPTGIGPAILPLVPDFSEETYQKVCKHIEAKIEIFNTAALEQECDVNFLLSQDGMIRTYIAHLEEMKERASYIMRTYGGSNRYYAIYQVYRMAELCQIEFLTRIKNENVLVPAKPMIKDICEIYRNIKVSNKG